MSSPKRLAPQGERAKLQVRVPARKSSAVGARHKNQLLRQRVNPIGVDAKPATPNAVDSSFGAKRLQRPKSAPALRLDKLKMQACEQGTPFKQPQPLYEVNLRGRTWEKHAVPSTGPIRSVSCGRLVFKTAERGLEYDMFGKEAVSPKKLPRVEDVITAVNREFNIIWCSSRPKSQGQWKSNSRNRYQTHVGKSNADRLRDPFALAANPEDSRSDHTGLLPEIMELAPVSDPANVVQVALKQEGNAEPELSEHGRDESMPMTGSQGSQDFSDMQDFSRSISDFHGRPSGFAIDGELIAANLEKRRNAVARADVVSAMLQRSRGDRLSPHTPVEEVLAAMDAKGIVVPWSEEKLKEAYASHASADSTEIPVQGLEKALVDLGIEGMREDHQDHVIAIASKLTSFGSLSFLEFLDFVRHYRQHELSELWELFCEADIDGSGAIDLNELHELCETLGYRLSRQTLRELNNAFDGDADGVIDIFEFEQMLYYVRTTAGFAAKELESYRELFLLLAGCENRALPAEDVWRLLIYVGFPADKGEVVRLVQELQCEKDAFGQIVSRHESPLRFHDCLKVIRAYRDFEHSLFAELIREHMYKKLDLIAVKDLGQAFGTMNYHASDELIAEILHKLDDRKHKDALTIEDMESFAKDYRQTDGFTYDEIMDIREAFERGERTRSEGRSAIALGALDALGIGQALRWLGFSVKLAEQLRAMKEVDIFSPPGLQFHELVKLVRRLRLKEAEKRRAVYESVVGGDTQRLLPMEQISHALARVNGVLPSRKAINITINTWLARQSGEETTAEEMHIDCGDCWPNTLNLHDFQQICDIHFQLDSIAGKAHAGYTAREVESLRKRFKQFDTDGDCTINRSELETLLGQLFPGVLVAEQQDDALDRSRWLRDLLADIDTDQNGELEFGEFLWLMRAADDARDAADVAEERQVVEEAGLSQEEADGFRDIFLGKTNHVGEVPLAKVLEMLDFADFTKERTLKVISVARGMIHNGAQGHDGLRFPEFLRFLQTVLSDESLGISQAATRVIHQELQKKRRSDIARENAAPSRHERRRLGKLGMMMHSISGSLTGGHG